MPEPPHCIGREMLDTMAVAAAAIDYGAERVDGQSDGEGDDDDDDDDTDESETLDDVDENNMMSKILEEDEVLGRILDENAALKSRKWCESPERLESILKYPYAGLDENSGNILPLISVAVINMGPTEQPTPPSSTNELSNGKLASTESGNVLPGNMSTSSSLLGDTVSKTNNNVTHIGLQTMYEPTGQTDKKGMHPPGASILFRCVPVPGPGRFAHRFLRKTTWKLTCEEEGWVGRPMPCEDEDVDIEELANRTCIYAPELTKGENVLAFYGDQLMDDYEEYQPGIELTFRCVDIGKYAMIGSQTRKCSYGDWDGVRPSCYGLSQEHDYAREYI